MLSTDGRGSLGGGPGTTYGAATASLAGPALYQLNAARTGRGLRDYRMAESVGLFTVPVYTDADAYLKAAWWAAVAAQLQAPSGSAGLIAVAQRYYQQGASLAFSGSGAQGSATAILQQASREVAAYAMIQPVRGIANFLNDLGQSEVVLQQAQGGADPSGLQTVLGDVSQYVWLGVGVFVLAVIALSRSRAE
jgi:hypothetical protein